MSLQQRLQSNNGPGGQGGGTGDNLPVPASIIVAEPEKATVDPFGDLKSRVHHDVITRIGPRLFARAEAEGTSELAERVREAVDEAIAIDKTPLTRQERAQVAREIADDILGYGPLEPFLRDETVSEILVNAPHSIYIERCGKLTITNAQFVDDSHLLRIIDKI